MQEYCTNTFRSTAAHFESKRLYVCIFLYRKDCAKQLGGKLNHRPTAGKTKARKHRVYGLFSLAPPVGLEQKNSQATCLRAFHSCGKRDLNSVRGLFKVLQIAQKRRFCEISRLPPCCDLCRFFAESKTDKRQINVKVSGKAADIT